MNFSFGMWVIDLSGFVLGESGCGANKALEDRRILVQRGELGGYLIILIWFAL